MNKKILVIGLSLICMLPTQKLIGAGDGNRKDAGYYNCLPEDGDDIKAYAASVLTLPASRPRKKSKKVEPLRVNEPEEQFIRVNELTMKNFVDFVNNKVHAYLVANDAVTIGKDLLPYVAVSLIAPSIMLYLYGSADTAMPAIEFINGSGSGCEKVMPYLTRCLKDTKYGCLSTLKVTPDLMTCAQSCGYTTHESALELDHLYNSSQSIVDQMKKDGEYLEDQQKKLIGGAPDLEWMRWEWIPEFNRRSQLAIQTLPGVEKRLIAERKKLNSLLIACLKK